MKTRTVTERVGELLGPVDWSYNFLGHFGGYCFREEKDREELCRKKVEWLRMVADEPDRYEVTTYGGWPRCGWHDVVAVGMYDGWPYWRPVPSICHCGTLGCEWHSFESITNIYDKATGKVV